jgi:hypothetical protein
MSRSASSSDANILDLQVCQNNNSVLEGFERWFASSPEEGARSKQIVPLVQSKGCSLSQD